MDHRMVYDAARFWSYADRSVPNGCWLWMGSRDRYGYGQFGGKKRSAHRIAYELSVGAIPDGLQIDHVCRVRHCVNPDHLEPVTQAENLRRGANIEFTDKDVIDRYAAGMGLAAIAAELGTNRGTVTYRLKRAGVEVRPRGRPRRK